MWGNRWQTCAAALLVLTAVLAALVGCSSSPAASPSQPSAPAQPSQGGTSPSTVAWTPDGVITDGEYTGDQDLGPYHLYWRQAGDLIEIGMVANTTGWLAVGIQPGRTMLNADLILGDVTASGVNIADEYSTGPTGPHSDDAALGGTYDILDYGGAETGDYTTIEFSRKMDTGDKYDNPISASGSTQILWSLGTSDNIKMQHGSRGYGAIVLP